MLYEIGHAYPARRYTQWRIYDFISHFLWSLMLSHRGTPYTFLFFPMVKQIFLAGGMAHPPPEYATGHTVDSGWIKSTGCANCRSVVKPTDSSTTLEGISCGIKSQKKLIRSFDCGLWSTCCIQVPQTQQCQLMNVQTFVPLFLVILWTKLTIWNIQFWKNYAHSVLNFSFRRSTSHKPTIWEHSFLSR